MLGNAYDEGSVPALIKIDMDELGYYGAIRSNDDINEKEYCPEGTLTSNIVEETIWEESNKTKGLALYAIPILAPIPFGTDIKSLTFDEAFVTEMQGISPAHAFWVETMVEVIEQYVLDGESDVPMVINKLLLAKEKSKGRDPTIKAATKGIRTHIFVAGPFIETVNINAGTEHNEQQNIVRSFFYRNPTPSKPSASSTSSSTAKHAAPTSAASNTPPPAMWGALMTTLEGLQKQQQSKIVVETKEHEELTELSKHQNNVNKLMFASAKIDWKTGKVENVEIATFSKGYLNIVDNSQAVKVQKLSNLLMTIFTTNDDDSSDEDDKPRSALDRLMSMYVIPEKFAKLHINANYQSSELAIGEVFKSTSLNVFAYAPQNDRSAVMLAKKRLDEERNEIQWKLTEKTKTTSTIEGIGRISTIDDVSKTCANLIGVIMAMIDVNGTKPIIYQQAAKMLRFIENKNTRAWLNANESALAHLPFIFMSQLHSVFKACAGFSQNSINNNIVELGNNDKLDIKLLTTAIRTVSKFYVKMLEHIEENSVPTNIPVFAKDMFVDNSKTAPIRITDQSGIINAVVGKKPNDPPTTPIVKKRKSTGDDGLDKKKPNKKGANKALEKGIFFLKDLSLPAMKVLPEKNALSKGLCLDFCSHGRACKRPTALCNFEHYMKWSDIPTEDKTVLLKHMDKTGSMWLDSDAVKDNSEIPSEFAYLLGNATGPKPKST